ncbi:MAG: translation initiation factor IF-2 N-terminal domain-containing protein, partial [Planctomycetaceae bacterium]|nr:translation initiation factor IF-2 N-terminal domain-containing protein [Planctomycetaceae bacterium]
MLKIRIFALARELGLDSKVLIQLCDEAGITLRNALATITPEERDRIVEFVQNREKKGGPAKTDEPLAPSRDPSISGKIRDIRVMPSRTTRSESGQPLDADFEQQEVEEFTEVAEQPVATVSESETAAGYVAEVESESTSVVADDSADTETEDVQAESVDTEESDVADEPTSAESSSAPTTSSTELPGTESVSPAAETPVQPPETTRPSAPTRQQPVRSSAPIQRMKRPMQREMRPIGSVNREAAAEAPREAPPTPPVREKERERPARPLVAAPPSYQPPVPKTKSVKTTEKAMKPDMALSDIIDRSSPLADQIKKLKEVRAEHDDVSQGNVRRGARRGSLLNELRESREAQRQAKKLRRKKRSGPADLKTSAQIQFPITIRNLSEAIGRPAKSIISHFFRDGRMMTINDELSEEDALEVAMELGVDLEIKRGRDIEAELVASLDHDDDPESMETRPPIITILGHVDHGKT